jgi:hypothetical protein
MGMMERGGHVRAFVVDGQGKAELQKQVCEHVEAGAAIFGDELQSYEGLNADYEHAVMDHAVEYVNGNVHTNNLESFWNLLKRSLKGTYVGVEPFYLFGYLDEQAFRFNNRKAAGDWERCSELVSSVLDKRLTYAELTGKLGENAKLTLSAGFVAVAGSLRVPRRPRAVWDSDRLAADIPFHGDLVLLLRVERRARDLLNP